MVPSLPSSPRRSPSGRSAPITVPFAVLEPEQPMFESLSDRFEGILTRLRGRGRLSEADVDEVLREIRTALLEADVEIGVVRTFTDAVRARCVGLELPRALQAGQQVIKIVNEELVAILGGETLKITYAGRPPTVILLAGLQGSGKTTTSAKLARWFKQQGRNPLLVGADLQRPAAVQQLRVLGDQAGITVFSEPTGPVAVAAAGLEEAKRLGRDVLIVDTAGRLAIDEDLMDEIRDIAGVVEPPCRSRKWWEGPSPSPPPARSSTTSTSSIPIAWPTGSSGWATCSA